jgi:hypothetical protein
VESTQSRRSLRHAVTDSAMTTRTVRWISGDLRMNLYCARNHTLDWDGAAIGERGHPHHPEPLHPGRPGRKACSAKRLPKRSRTGIAVQMRTLALLCLLFGATYRLQETESFLTIHGRAHL